MDKIAAQQFLQTVREATDGLPQWGDPDIFAVLCTEIKTGKQLIVTSVADDGCQVFVRAFPTTRADRFSAMHDAPIYHNGWWATLEAVDDWRAMRRNGLIVKHESIVAEFGESVKTSVPV